LASSSHAEVYKWVDAAGQTHYSQRKADAQGAKTAEVKITAAPEQPQTSVPSADYLRAQSKFAAAPPKPTDAGGGSYPGKASPSLSDGRDHGTDGSRCALARDVLSGAVRHGNGKPTDRYDREVAQSDVKNFCRSR
jgi:hypothetical protein